MTGQHVGGVSDALVEDEVRSAARARQEALKALARPAAGNRGSYGDLGDGDVCPLDRTHRKMFHIKGTDRQHCGDQAHDGRPRSHPEGHAPATRSFWPLGDIAFAEAVRTHLEAH